MSKPRVLFCLAMAAVALSVSPVRVMAVPACPGPAQVTQPDGTPITVYLRGDEYAHWNESSDGYHITRNDRREWVYMVSDNGPAVASEHAVGRADPHAVGALKPDKAALSQRGRQSRALRADAEGTSDSTQTSAQESPNLTQTTGTTYNLVVLVNFSDLTVAYSTQDYEDLFNQIGYTTDGAVGSVKDYYHEVSYDALTVQSVVPEPVTLANGYAYYGANSPVTGNDLRPREMVAEALAALEARGFDFTSVDGDSDGEIDGLTIIHAGGGEEYGGNDEDYIWSHQWALISPVTYDGVTMYTYHTEPARRGWDSSPSTQGITRIGVICHEHGHFLGLPDLYDYGYDSEGAGDFCLMAGGSWNGSYGTTPAHMSAWCKSELTWITPTVVSVDGLYSLGQVETNAQAYKLQGPFPSTQYFLVENRQGIGFDAGLPGPLRGILIWHVDETQPDNDDQTHYLVDLEEASGTQHLELNQNEGDDADYFRSGNATEFGETSTPNHLSYSGVPLGLDITDVSSAGTTMTFQVGDLIVPTPPVASDIVELTPLDTPITVTLTATDEGLPDPPNALSYIITTLPSHGTLSDPSAGAISSVPYTLLSNGKQVNYTPDAGYAGSDSFQYKANDGGTPPDGGDSNTATVTINIAAISVIYSATMDTNPGWTYEGDWEWGVPAGSGGAYSNPDPTSGHTGANVVGYNLSGDYKKIQSTKWVTTNAINCTGQTGVTLSFYRWLNVEDPQYDHAYVQVSNNASSWSTIWQNTAEVTDSSWEPMEYDISAIADNQPTVYVRWGMGATDNFWHYSGWNIDDMQITGTVPITQYTLTVSSTSGGSVAAPGEGAFQYDQGTVVDVNAVPELHYHFVDWTGTAVDAGKVANPASAATTVTVDSDYTIQANFAIDTFTLDYAAGPFGTLTGDTSQVVAYGGSGTAVTAVPDTGYHFVNWSDDSTDNPRTDVNVSANVNVTANFAHNPIIISGYVTEPDPNIPVAAVYIGTDGEPNAVTDPNGRYELVVDYGWSGSVIPFKEGYTFEPNSIEYENAVGDPNANYMATLDTFIISGYVVDAGTLDPLDGVLAAPDNDGGPFTSKYYGGADVTDANGFYEVLVDYNFSGDVVPSKYAYAFEPNGITYANVTSHIAEPNHYAGALLTYTIAGYIKNACEVPIQDVLVQASSGGTSDSTDPNGFYEVWVDYNFSGTITPSKQNYTFDPNTAAYANVLSDWMDENYLAANIYDLDCDGSIAIGDLAILTGHWLQTGPDVPGDFHKDPNDIVNLPDFAVFADVWGDE